MNHENILSEGFFDKVGKFFKLLSKVKKERKLMKNPLIARKVNKFNKDMDQLEGSIKDLAKKYGIEDKLES
tara:strand:+ start:45 stop:257 length:213 start_codon:yes stop_codon:yes gene_type:complete